MAPKRDLPERRNPLVDVEHTPPQEILIERRKLGQTDLSVKPGQVGVANASQAENLGKFDYAHLRVPLPKDLKGSGIFTAKNQAYPESYFLMRRSSDGYVSATGMFKAAFPWASIQEESTERIHHKGLKSAGPSEVAGNVWISPLDALKLADEYRMLPWIIALLSTERIEKPHKDAHLDIVSPPDYNVPPRFLKKEFELSNPAEPPAGATLPPPSPARRRELRSASPAKFSGTPARKIASPRKRTVKKDATPSEDGKATGEKGGKSRNASAASKALQQLVANGASEEKKEPPPSTDAANDTVTIEVDEAVSKVGDKEVTTTAVRVEIPAEHPDLPPPQDSGELVATANELVSEAKKLEGSKKRGSKRKAEDMEEEPVVEAKEVEDEAKPAEVSEEPAAKRVKTEAVAKQEKVRTRAYVGLAATLAVGAGITFFFG